jgi:Amt family ammonium transporter
LVRAALALGLASVAIAQGESVEDVAFAIDTIGLLLCAFLVAFMQPGFALLESGLHSSKSVVNIFMKNIADFTISGLAYWAVGFGIMYGGGMFLSNYVTGMNVPNSADFFFQMVFAATASTIVSGAVGGRSRFSAFLIFAVIMTGFVYPVLGQWKWGLGWLDQRGFVDFAGSSVVHAVGGFASLGAVLALGPRIGRYVGNRVVPMPGHSMPLAGLGLFFLWIGWFGFNGGSQLAFSTVADATAIADIILNTNLAAGAGGLAAMLVSWIAFGKPDISMTINGVLGGLVSITAGPDVITGLTAVLVGAIGGSIVVGSVVTFDRIRIDDPVGAISVHGIAGIWGTVAVGIFGGANLGVQLLGTLSYAGAAFVAGFAIFYLLKLVGLARVTPTEEVLGLDVSEHGMTGYHSDDSLGDPVLVGAGD